MRTDPSVHPCLDTFDILMTTPNITDDKYIRLIRVYTSNHTQRYYANTLKLDYVREFKLPLNNYLKMDCHLFDANFRYYCFVFVALSRTTGAVLINSRPHCRPTTMQLIVTSQTPGPYGVEDNTINSLNKDNHYLEQLRPAGPSYKYYDNPTKATSDNIHRNSRRISTSANSVGSGTANNDFDKYDNYFNEEDIENTGHYINIKCKCSNSYDIESNVTKVTISLDLIVCDKNNNDFKNNMFGNNNNSLDISEGDVSLETTGALESPNSVLSPSESHLIDKNSMKNTMKTKTKRYLSDTRDFSDHSSDNTESADSVGNYPGILSTICVLNLMESNYKMKVQFENWRNIPVIYVHSTTAHTPQLVVREGRLAIDPQLDINNKSQIHSIKSRYLRIESFYAQNLTLKLILLKTNNKFLYEKYSTFRVFLTSLTPIHYTSVALIVLFVICLMALILISITSPQRKITVKIVTPSEEGDPTRTSYMEPTEVMSQFSLPDDNQSLEMDYYDYLLPFVPRPQSRATTDLE